MPLVRCPGCGSSQPDTAVSCERCGASLTEIVVGYASRDELANDRDALEADGWQIVGITDGGDDAPLSVRFQRGALAAQRRLAPSSKRPARPAASPRLVLVGFALLLVAAVAVGGVVRWATATHPAAAVTPPAAVIVSIGGAPGIAFRGTIAEASGNREIAGETPQTFRTDPSPDYAIVVQKQTEALSLLTVTLACAGGARFSSSTSVGRGIVTLSGSCEH